MKKLVFLISLTLLITACFGKKSPKPGQSNLDYAMIDAESGKAKLEYLSEPPKDPDPAAILFIKVKPGTVTVGELRSSNEDDYFIMTKPMTKKQLSKLIGTEDGDGLASSTPFEQIEKAIGKLSKSNDEQFSLPTAQQWDFAFLSGKVNENDQPICWEWALLNGGNNYTWRGRMWHIMELYEEAEHERDKDAVQSDLGFRFIFKEGKAK
ncbi:hypothetical protein IKZ40_05240 [bacterium]|nr:hypothetical protein [bacterium]